MYKRQCLVWSSLHKNGKMVCRRRKRGGGDSVKYRKNSVPGKQRGKKYSEAVRTDVYKRQAVHCAGRDLREGA